MPVTSTTPDRTTEPTSSTTPADPPRRRPGLNTDTLALGGVFIAMFAFLAAVFAVGLAARAIDEHREVEQAIAHGALAAPPGGATRRLSVTLQEFKINPTQIELPAGGAVITVANDGTVTHNLSVDGKASQMLAGGDSGQLDLTGLKPGTYEMRCDVPGHAEAGMKGTLTVG